MDQRTQLLRHRFLITLTAGLVGVLVVALVNNLNIGERSAALAEGVCAVILLIGWIIYLRGGARRFLPLLILVVDIAIIHLLYITLRGNTLAGAYSLTVMFPVIAGYFLSARRFLIWSGLFVLSLFVHVAVAGAGIIETGLTWSNLVRLLIVYILVVYITKSDRWMTEVFTTTVQHEADTQTQLAAGLRQEVEAVKEAERAKSLFVSLASHQLRSPLTALRWSLEAYRHKSTQLLPPEKEMIDLAHASTMRMIHLVTDLLNVSRIESGRLRVVPSPTNLITLISNVVTDMRPLAEVKQIDLEIDIPTAPVMLNIDSVLVSQVVINFLSNAIKYSPAKQRVELRLTVGRDDVRCEVTDHGIGIPTTEQPKVFQEMFRASNAQRIDETGSGLGLFLAKSIIVLTGGKIGFSSNARAGSTFWFTLPKTGSPAIRGEIGYEKNIPV